MNTPTRRSFAVATAAGLAAVALAACSGDDAPQVPNTPAPALTVANPALAGLVGPGCAAYVDQTPTGKGSVGWMGQYPLAQAAAGSPLLKTLTTALAGKMNREVDLVGTMNGGEYTLFAPVDAAFRKVPPATTAKFETDAPLLVKVLTYHVVAGQLAPDQVVGKVKSVEGGDLEVTGSGNTLKVNGAAVVCGGIRTANATVYLIDSVLSVPR
jgi:uncharacterized surface protein with fasciclin (FAS1) repeats